MDGMARWSSARVQEWIVKDSSHYRFVDSLLSLVYGSQIQTVELTRIRGQISPKKLGTIIMRSFSGTLLTVALGSNGE